MEGPPSILPTMWEEKSRACRGDSRTYSEGEKMGPGKIFGSLFLVAAVIVGVSAARQWVVAKRMIAVSGEMKSITYDHSKVGGSKANTYNVRALYSYAHNGKEYEGSLVSLRGNFYSKEGDAVLMVNKYSGMGSIKVWIDPKRPNLGILEEPNVDSRSWLLIGGLVVAAFVSFKYLDTLVMSLKSSRES